jgi:hypothetical protein
MIMYSLSHPLFNGLLADGYLAKHLTALLIEQKLGRLIADGTVPASWDSVIARGFAVESLLRIGQGRPVTG